MEELKFEELEELVQELDGESEEEEALSPEVEELLRDLQQSRAWMTRLKAAECLGALSESSPRVVQSLVVAGRSDSMLGVREAAEESLRAPVHQEILREYPDLMQRARSAAEQAAIQREEQKEKEREIQTVLEASAEESLSPEVEKLLRGLGPWSPEHTRRDAAAQLARLGTSSPRIVKALIRACESPSDLVSTAAAKSLRAPVHQECLQQHPDLAAAAKSALQQAPDTDWLEGTLSGQGRDASVQRRIYPKLRIQQRPLVARILGVPFVLFGLGALVLSAVAVTGGIDLTVLFLGLFGLVFTYVGLLVSGLDLREMLLALLHRRVWQGPRTTTDGRITNRDIKEHKHKDDYGRVSYTYTYWITFDFSTTDGPVRLKAPVDEQRYGQLRRGQPVKVRYAQEDPRLALLEWEE